METRGKKLDNNLVLIIELGMAFVYVFMVSGGLRHLYRAKLHWQISLFQITFFRCVPCSSLKHDPDSEFRGKSFFCSQT